MLTGRAFRTAVHSARIVLGHFVLTTEKQASVLEGETLNQSESGTETGDGEIDRSARLRSFAPVGSDVMLKPGSATNTSALPTYSRTWFTPRAFKILDDRTKAEMVCQKFPKEGQSRR